ncbi:hypothetical protein GCM10009630_53480 [Kribbella jejuensis]
MEDVLTGGCGDGWRWLALACSAAVRSLRSLPYRLDTLPPTPGLAPVFPGCRPGICELPLPPGCCELPLAGGCLAGALREAAGGGWRGLRVVEVVTNGCTPRVLRECSGCSAPSRSPRSHPPSGWRRHFADGAGVVVSCHSRVTALAVVAG